MIIDHRTYTLQPRKVPEYLKIFQEHGLPVQQKHLGDPVGYYFTEVGPQNQIVHLWGYEDMGDMETRRAARSADPAWAAYQSHTTGMTVHQETRLIRPAPFFSPKRGKRRGRLIDHRTYRFKPNRLKEWLKLFEEMALPVQCKHIGEPVGFYVTEVGRPTQVTHMWAFEDMADMETRRAARNADPAWAAYLEKQGDMIEDMETKLLRPAPFFVPS